MIVQCSGVSDKCSTVCFHKKPHSNNLSGELETRKSCGDKINCVLAEIDVQCLPVKTSMFICGAAGSTNKCHDFCTHGVLHAKEDKCGKDGCVWLNNEPVSCVEVPPAKPPPMLIMYAERIIRRITTIVYCCNYMHDAVKEEFLQIGYAEEHDGDDTNIYLNERSMSYCPFCGAEIKAEKSGR